jgi:hypothetical protein
MVIVVGTSGSIGADVEPERIHVLYCDAAAQSVEEFLPAEPVVSQVVLGWQPLRLPISSSCATASCRVAATTMEKSPLGQRHRYGLDLISTSPSGTVRPTRPSDKPLSK